MRLVRAVKVDAVRLPSTPPDELVVIELERGVHRATTPPLPAGSARQAWAALEPLAVQVRDDDQDDHWTIPLAIMVGGSDNGGGYADSVLVDHV